MKALRVYFVLLSTVIQIGLYPEKSIADNTYRYFYLYRNSDAYQDYHQEDSTPTEDQEENDFQLYEEERDYYVNGDEEYADEENYEEETEETDSGDNDDYQD